MANEDNNKSVLGHIGQLVKEEVCMPRANLAPLTRGVCRS
jgi:hypothetical protein